MMTLSVVSVDYRTSCVAAVDTLIKGQAVSTEAQRRPLTHIHRSFPSHSTSRLLGPTEGAFFNWEK